MRSAITATALCVLAVTACRDAVSYAPAEPRDETGNTPEVVQLTYNTGSDLNPVWSRNSDTVYYAATRFADAPGQASVLLGINRTGGIAHILLPATQRTSHWQATPAIAPDGSHIAYVDLVGVLSPLACLTLPPPPPGSPSPCPAEEPRLDSAVLHVRSLADGGQGGIADFAFRFPGSDPNRTMQNGGPYVQVVYPFQESFDQDHISAFRPSWSPDGTRIVFSDGIQLYTWTPGSPNAPVVIPNTKDGVSPAWSPDGNHIAFTRLVRTDSASVTCNCSNPAAPSAAPALTTRKTYTIGARTLTVIDPDGTNAVALTSGEDPGWSPDSQQLYFRDLDNIYRIAVNGGERTLIPNTSHGIGPAVSPDGKWLAFSRNPAILGPDANVWVVRTNVQ